VAYAGRKPVIVDSKHPKASRTTLLIYTSSVSVGRRLETLLGQTPTFLKGEENLKGKASPCSRSPPKTPIIPKTTR
jgi:hypothetical protein